MTEGKALATCALIDLQKTPATILICVMLALLAQNLNHRCVVRHKFLPYVSSNVKDVFDELLCRGSHRYFHLVLSQA